MDYWQAWVYGFVFFATTTAIGIYFLKRDPRVVERRVRVGPAAEREPVQKIIMTLLLAGFVLLVIPLVPVLGWRLLDEDRFLARELPDYVEYCRKVRYLLVPGIW